LFEVVGVLTDRACGALKFAKKNNIYCQTLSFKRIDEEDQKLIKVLNDLTPDLIITNVHKILSEKVVDAFDGKLINLHYSYLPAFGGLIGMEPVKKASVRGNTFVGCTAHLVNQKVDDGKTLAQGIICIYNRANIFQKVFECGALTLLVAILEKLSINDLDNQFFSECWMSPFYSKIDKAKTDEIFRELQNEFDSLNQASK